MNAAVLIPAGVAPLLCWNWNPAVPVRSFDQSIARWYWFLSCTSAIVASIRTCRFTFDITWSRNSWIFSCWREVALIERIPASGFEITEAASRNSMAWGAGGAPTAGDPVTGGATGGAKGEPGVPCWAPGWIAATGGGGAAGCVPGISLSLSRKRSRTFPTSVSQKRLLETLLTVETELLLMVPTPPEPPEA